MILYKKSMKRGEKSLRKLIDFELADIFIYFIMDFDTSDSSEVISSSVGYPVNMQIFYIWSKVELPANRGFWANISYTIQPKLHISAGVE